MRSASWSPEKPDPSRHGGRAGDDQSHAGQLPKDNAADPPHCGLGHDGQDAFAQWLPPFEELDRWIDRQQSHNREEGDLGNECRVVEVVGGSFLEEEDTQQPDREHHAGRYAEETIGVEDPPGARKGQVVAGEHAFDRQCRDECKSGTVVQEGEQYRGNVSDLIPGLIVCDRQSSLLRLAPLTLCSRRLALVASRG